MNTKNQSPDHDAALIEAIDRVRDESGHMSWPATEVADVARRRWRTYARRHKKQKSPTHDDRVRDLAKGIQAHFEPGGLYTPWAEWQYMAEQLGAALKNT